MLLIFTCISGVAVTAQGIMNAGGLYGPGFHQYRPGTLSGDSSLLARKWSMSTFAGFNTGFGFWNGNSTTMMSAPIGIQVNRQITRNLFAFGAVSTAPVYFNMNGMLPAGNFNKNQTGFNRIGNNQFGIYSRAEAGLMYINDERTFLISGSIGVSHYNYPSFTNPAINNIRQQPVATQRP